MYPATGQAKPTEEEVITEENVYERPDETMGFVPTQVLNDLVVSTLILLSCVVLSYFAPAPLTDPAAIRDSLVAKGFDAWWMDATDPDWHSNLSVEERAFQMTSPATGVPGAAPLARAIMRLATSCATKKAPLVLVSKTKS